MKRLNYPPDFILVHILCVRTELDHLLAFQPLHVERVALMERPPAPLMNKELGSFQVGHIVIELPEFMD